MTRRIALAILLTCWAALLVGGVLSYVGVRHALLAELDASLVLRASSLPDVLDVSEAPAGFTLPEGDRYIIRNHLGQTMARSGTRAAGTREAEVRSTRFADVAGGGGAGRTRSVIVAFRDPATGGEMTVVYSGSAERFDRLLGRLALVVAGVGLAAGLLTAGVALAVARSALRPLTAAVATIRSIDERTLDRRLEPAQLPEELRPMGERLNQMLGRLEDGLRERKQFMADAAHQLRTPVTALLTSMEVALRRPRDAAALTQVLREGVGDAKVMRRLVEALLEQFRSDAAGTSLQAVNVSAVLDLCADSVAGLARQREVTVARSYPGELWAVTDGGRLRSIVANLLDNALEYNVPGGSVELSCAAEAGVIHLTVRDTGRGIPEDLVPHVFDPFFRGPDDAGKSEMRHCGLGLFLVNSHVAALGGTCALRSVPGEGTEFRITVPAPRAPSPPPTPNSPASGAADGGNDSKDVEVKALTTVSS